MTPRSFDPREIEDPLARTTAWSPCQEGDRNVCTRRLAGVGANRIRFRTTLSDWLFALPFILLGGTVFGAGVLGLAAGPPKPGNVLGGMLAGLAFGAPPAVILWKATRPIVFDRRAGTFFKAASGTTVPLGRLHALQLLTKRSAVVSKPGFYRHELNLVLDDGSRVGVVVQTQRALLQQDAVDLADCLEVPLWDTDGAVVDGA